MRLRDGSSFPSCRGGDREPLYRHVPRAAGRVWKFELPEPFGGVCGVDLPGAARTMSVGIQGDKMVVWALVGDVDLDAGLSRREYIVLNTGQSFSYDELRCGEWVGTVTSENGIVWHVWEVEPL